MIYNTADVLTESIFHTHYHTVWEQIVHHVPLFSLGIPFPFLTQAESARLQPNP